jgi:hypothetical protein
MMDETFLTSVNKSHTKESFVIWTWFRGCSKNVQYLLGIWKYKVMDNNSANISKTNNHLLSQTIEHKIDNDIFMSNYNIRWFQYTKFTDCPLELVIVQVTEVDIFKYNPINSSCFLNFKWLTDYSLSFNR